MGTFVKKTEIDVFDESIKAGDDIFVYIDSVYEEESRRKRMDEIYQSVFKENIFESVCTFRKPVDIDKPVSMFPMPLLPRIPWIVFDDIADRRN